MKILTLQNYYLPGHRGGGCIRAVSNLVAALGGEIDFLILCNDRDLGVDSAYPGIRTGEWSRVGKALVRYTEPDLVMRTIARELRSGGHDVVYVNSIFERRYAMWPLLLRWLGWSRDVPFVLAPRGELGGNALRIRGGRKRIFLWLACRLGLLDGLVWHATSHTEEAEIAEFLREWRIRGRMTRADDLPGSSEPVTPARTRKVAGRARLVFLSRIVPKKNLAYAISVLRGVRSEVEFDIFGPREDSDYWSRCEAGISALPANVKVNYRGIAAHEDVVRILSGYDLFFFPTLNENFGYVIYEAMRGGCPVLLSDQTPWGAVVESGAGWVAGLEDPAGFAAVIEEVAARDEEGHRRQSERAMAFAARVAADDMAVEAHRRIFGAPGETCP